MLDVYCNLLWLIPKATSLGALEPLQENSPKMLMIEAKDTAAKKSVAIILVNIDFFSIMLSF